MQDVKLLADPDHISLVKDKYLHNERLNADERLRFSKRLNEINLQRMSMGEDHQVKTVEINTFMIKEADDKKNMQTKLQEQRQFMGRRFRMSNETLILRFFKFLITKLPDKNVVFNISKGIVRNKVGGDARVQKARTVKTRGFFVSVRDPFLKDENHGIYLRDENNFNRLIIKLKQFIREASQGRLEDFLLEAEAEADPEPKKEDEKKQGAKDEKVESIKMKA